MKDNDTLITVTSTMTTMATMGTTMITMITMDTITVELGFRIARHGLETSTMITMTPWMTTMITMTTLDVYTSTMNTMDTSKRQPSRVRAHNCWGLELATSGLQGP